MSPRKSMWRSTMGEPSRRRGAAATVEYAGTLARCARWSPPLVTASGRRSRCVCAARLRFDSRLLRG